MVEQRSEDVSVKQVLENMRLRFSSRNSIPVERAFIPRVEWDVLLQYICELERLASDISEDFRDE